MPASCSSRVMFGSVVPNLAKFFTPVLPSHHLHCPPPYPITMFDINAIRAKIEAQRRQQQEEERRLREELLEAEQREAERIAAEEEQRLAAEAAEQRAEAEAAERWQVVLAKLRASEE